MAAERAVQRSYRRDRRLGRVRGGGCSIAAGAAARFGTGNREEELGESVPGDHITLRVALLLLRDELHRVVGVEPSVSGRKSGDGAIVMISSRVRKGCEEEYRRWQERTDEAARRFPGFERMETYPPGSGEQNTWMVVFRFSSPDQLNAWLNSDVRRGLLEEGRAFLEERAARPDGPAPGG
ncbi:MULTISPECIES: antibiotic biosynthesis monooxygenase [Streptosporangium]|nr:antibiotic biosynthesis monooxygenase [Streptosporangium sandarakinum]